MTTLAVDADARDLAAAEHLVHRLDAARHEPGRRHGASTSWLALRMSA
jgi:hypothetical protein